jgi:putative MATE family efflux protein
MAEEAFEATAIEAEPSDSSHSGASSKARSKQEARRAVILEGPIHKGVLAIALPSVATMLLQTTNGMLDRFFVGRLGPDALAAITVGSSLMFALMAAAMAISVGTTALVARFIGEGNRTDAVVATRQSLLLSLFVSVAVGVPMYLLRDPLLALLGLDAGAKELAAHYLAVTILGLPFLMLMLTFNGTFRGMGDTTRPFWVTLGANLVHAVFNWLLIFGNLGFPRLGLAGGALALALSQAMATLLYAIFLRGTVLGDALTRRTVTVGERSFGWRVDTDWVKRISRIGLPASAQQLIRVGSMLAFQSLLARSGAGSPAVAALGVGLVSESIAFMPGFGYSIAASAFVGQNLGARKVRRAQQGAWAATWQAVGVMTVMGVVFYLAAEPFAHLFIQHGAGETALQAGQVAETTRLTSSYLRTAAWSEPFLGLGMVLTGALQGAGETASPTVLTILTMVIIRLPLAWYVLNHTSYGTLGAWWVMAFSTVVQGLMTVYVFRLGRWRNVRV